MKLLRGNIGLILQIVIVITVLLLPLAYTEPQHPLTLRSYLLRTSQLLAMLIVYYVNYLWLVPRLLRGNKRLFFIVNIILISLLSICVHDSIRLLVERLQREAQKRMMPTPDVTGDKLIEAIAAQYPGKAVFIDLWATWCGPCKIGISAMEPLKKKLEGRDVVFVYLTNETSPENEWKKQVANIPGLHYRVTEETWNQIPNISGIPQYYLYDRQGSRVWEHLGFGDETLQDIEQQIEKAIR